MPYRGDDALDIRAARRAEEASVLVESQGVSARSVVGSPDSSFSFGPRAARPATGQAGDRYFADDVGWVYYFTGLAWAYLAGIGYGTNAARAAISVSSVDNGAWWFVSDADVNNGFWRVVSGAWAQQFPPASLTVGTSYKVGANQVVGARKTGWGTATGTATRTTFDTAAVTLPELAERVKALIDDLHQTAGHGVIGT